ncbi:ankyrin repeat domain-containing protein, partial [Staphylococcus pseudintermedius]
INVVRLLIDAGAKVNVKDIKDKTALSYASE